MIAQRIQPPRKGQTLKDSCWAACLDAFSKADGRFHDFLSEMDLVGEYAQTLTGGITPAEVFPKFESRWRMWSDAYDDIGLWRTMTFELAKSHLIASYKQGPGQWHAVLIYKITDDFQIHGMNPANGGAFGSEGIQFFLQRAPVALLGFR